MRRGLLLRVVDVTTLFVPPISGNNALGIIIPSDSNSASPSARASVGRLVYMFSHDWSLACRLLGIPTSSSDSTPQNFSKSNVYIRSFQFSKVGISAERRSRL